MSGRLTTTPLKAYPPASAGIVVSCAVADTFGSWVEFVSSAAADLTLAGFSVDTGVGTDFAESWFQMQFGVGSIGNEVVIGTYLARYGSASTGPKIFLFSTPLFGHVPLGSRVCMRWRRATTATLSTFLLLAYEGAFVGDNHTTATLNCIPAPGAAAVTPTTVLTPNASAWVNSAWVELAAAALFTEETSLDGLVAQPPAAAQDVEFDIGTGDSGSEVVISTCRVQGYGISGMNIIALPALYPLGFPSPRIAVRMRKSGTSVTTWPIGLRYYGGTDFIAACDGGGTMPSVAEITDSEDWRLLPTKQPNSWLTIY